MSMLLMAMSMSQPMISATRNFQPRKMRMMIPSSITRFVEANINATPAIKCAPFLMRARAAASAAKEQEDEAAPKNVDSEMLFRSPSPMYRVSFPFGTNAWIIPDTKYPRINAHPDFQKNPIAVLVDSP